MPREADLSISEKQFILQALQENTRLDGRGFDEIRPIKLSFGIEDGVADVELGQTRVIAKVSAEVTKPFPDRQFDGIFTITTELSPMASPALEAGKQTEQEVILSRILEKAIRRSQALDTESLCIIAGQKCWNVRVDVHVADYDGGLFDASCIAVIAALQHFKRPDVSVEGERVNIFSPAERVPVPLSILHHPICITSSFFAGGSTVLLDATLKEEQVREGELIITMNRHGEICQVAKLGGVPTDALALLNCANIAHAKAQEIIRFISGRIEEDRKARDMNNQISELIAENTR